MEWLICRKIVECINKKQIVEIRSLLKDYTPEERKEIVSKKVNKTSPLYTAIECKNLEFVNYLLYNCGANPNDTGREMGLECPCLWKAADLDQLEIAHELLQHGADVNGSNLLGSTALFTACQHGYLSMVTLLVLNKADVNSSNHEGMTCLMASISYPAICSYLLTRGARLNQVTVSGDSDLMIAIEASEVETFSILVKAGADPNITNHRGENAIFMAMDRNFPINLNYFQAAGQLRPEYLAFASEMKCCRYMINGEDQLANAQWQQALELRGLPKRTPIFQSKISHESKLQPIRNLLARSHSDVLIFLESKLGLRNAHTLEILKWIIYNTENLDNYIKLFNFFIEIINSTDDLLFFDMYANLHQLIVNFIFKNFHEEYNKVAFGRLLAIFDGISDHLENLSSRINSMNPADRLSKSHLIRLYMYLTLNLISSIKYQHEENIQEICMIYSKIVKLDLRGRHNASILHFCIGAGYDPRIIRILLSAGADINAKDDRGYTPVHLALASPKYRNKNMIDCFIKHGLRFEEILVDHPCFQCVLRKKNLLKYPVRNTSLQCLAANVVAKNYDTTKILLPEIIQMIIHSHTL